MEKPEVLKTRAIIAAQKQFSCAHSETELRKRVVSGGGIQRVRQCLVCGAARSQPLGKAAALAECGGQEPPPFDEALIQDWESRRKHAFAEIEQKFGYFGPQPSENDQTIDDWWPRYQAYLETPEWARVRGLVILRAQGVCEGCRLAPATTVHHLSYAHVTQEFLFELVALCEKCHNRIHSG